MHNTKSAVARSVTWLALQGKSPRDPPAGAPSIFRKACIPACIPACKPPTLAQEGPTAVQCAPWAISAHTCTA